MAFVIGTTALLDFYFNLENALAVSTFTAHKNAPAFSRGANEDRHFIAAIWAADLLFRTIHLATSKELGQVTAVHQSVGNVLILLGFIPGDGQSVFLLHFCVKVLLALGHGACYLDSSIPHDFAELRIIPQ